MERKLILFGAGNNGYKAIKKYGADNVAFLCDNDALKVGTKVEGISVVSFDEMESLYCEDYLVMITPENGAIQHEMVGQLENIGINDYTFFVENPNYTWIFNMTPFDENKKNDEHLKKIANMFCDIDLLENIEPLIKSYKKRSSNPDIPIHYSGRMSESFYYGNVDGIAEYGNLSDEDIEYGPIVSHYDCMPSYFATHYKSAVIMAGSFHKNKLHQKHPYVPVFTVGPYLQYVKGIYTPERLANTKKKIGTMLLAFMPHSIETTKRAYNRFLFIDNLINLYSGQFDSIWLCVYFADVLDEIVQYADSKGIHVVSSGYIFDANFNKRQRTMFDLSDAVVCGDIGTFLSYALFFNKPVARIDIPEIKSLTYEEFKTSAERSVHLTPELKEYEKKFSMVLSSEFCDGEEARVWMDDVAGFSFSRSPQYIKNIFEISKEIWLECEGNMRFYIDAVRHVYYKFLSTGELDKVKILLNSVGARIE